MDIENMHPFCLPFGLCYDATSLSANDNNTIEMDGVTSSNKSLSRSKTSSPTDELFRQLCNNNNNNCHSHDTLTLLDDDSIFAHGRGDEDDVFHYSLELDLELGQSDLDSSFNGSDESKTNTEERNLTSTGDADNDENGDDEVDDWYSINSQQSQFLFLSPTFGAYSNINGKRKGKRSLARHQHIVFQHIVDPNDIKSSPTLAQLNLNANDDPSEGLWDSNASSNQQHHHHHHQASNSTSIRVHHNPSRLSAQSRSLLSTLCTNGVTSAFGNNPFAASSASRSSLSTSSSATSLHAHGNTDLSTSSSSSSSSSSSTTTTTTTSNILNRTSPATMATASQNLCNQHNHLNQQNHQHQNHTHSNQNIYSNSTTSQICQHHHHQHHQHHHQLNHHQQSGGLLMAHNSGTGIQQNTPLSAASGHLLQQQSLISHNDAQNHRSTSPALVTSSSSPLSSSSASSLGPQATTTSTSQTPATTGYTNTNNNSNSKLKENIEYLTALLCNGSNKLDNTNQSQQQQQHQQQQQQPPASLSGSSPSSISTSTMVRSYATLAQSLSTGPKLLEHNNTAFSNNNNHLHMHHHLTKQISGNEATPFGSESTTNHYIPPTASQQQQRWFQNKGQAITGSNNPVESSVSAADSTDCQVSSLTNCTGGDSHLAHQLGQQSSYPLHINQQNIPVDCQQHTNNNQRSAPELKVLSSLLSANRCSSPQCSAANHQQQRQLPAPAFGTTAATTNGYNCNQWQDRIPASIAHHNQQHASLYSSQEPAKPEVSIPANGKPITLTPLNNSNSIIINQQPQPPKPRSNSVFAQPASPSTSSTTSSGGCLEIASSSSTSSASSNSNGPPSKKLKNSAGGATSVQQPVAGRKPTKGRANRPNSMSTDCSLSSHDEGFSSQVDNDDCTSNRDSDEDDDDDDSDDESFYGDYTNSDLIGASISDNAENKWTLNMGRTRRNGQKRYFWQYNVQSKGPKGTRICSTDSSENPFVLPEASDPVFSNDCQVEGVKHSGKARRGDGNDLTPNPRKLLMIGLELKKLGKIINDLAPVTDLPLNARNKTRKEKNKLASRACRLKKKAQHEANKIKLYGLQKEHQQVVMAIFDIRKILKEELHFQDSNPKATGQATSGRVETLADQCSMKVAGLTSDYVNSVLEKVVSGCIDGGLQT